MPDSTVRVPLGVLDHFLPPHYMPMKWYIPLKDAVTPQGAFKALEDGLRLTFRQLPWLSGKIYKADPGTPGGRPGQLEIRYDPAGLEDNSKPVPQFRFKLLDETVSYEEICDSGHPMDTIPDEEVFWGDFFNFPEVDKGAECFKAQANFVPGALILCGATHHNACDGAALFDVWRIWAANCAALQANTAPVVLDPLSSDRGLIERIWADEGSRLEHVDDAKGETGHVEAKSYTLLDMEPPNAPSKEDRRLPPPPPSSGEAMTSAVFYMSPDKFAALHKRCLDEAGAGSRISGNDSMAALIWRSLLKARHAAAMAAGRASESDNVEAWLQLTIDGRPNISAKGAMPFEYLGNLVFWNRVAMPISTLTSPNTGIATVATAIRREADAATRQAMLGAYGLGRRLEDVSKLQLSITHAHGYDMILSSLMMMRIEDTRWGGRLFANGGKADALRPLFDDVNKAGRLCFAMPREPGRGVEFVVNLFQDEWDYLLEDDEFGEYALYLTC
ncbi:hypothetical protein SMACR_01189 [Sordaria macrospora]|uniref:WGS project CABT00000000 data, contig 2.2 n=2 Tax=Sordaria macrospora TaxID=5147 RepID=F7VMI5_SORMK|nr:uncharacterized protein SMAC_01189 [Sordaria macrospora k-hell]KAA8633134.1 hypothetical protein SMACR_01189 [Sordaria macrospora]WPJ62426.1 hypothetical protein SMAC4_01189 [Sordaria macrospora]CCC07166.1 unnamed protein product [Sordaria macrospora k-hell]